MNIRWKGCIMKRSWLSAIADLGVCASLVVLSASAATQEIRRPTITRAGDLIVVPGQRILVDSPAAFRLKASAAARRLAREGVVVRIFSLAVDQKTPLPIAQVDDCDVYLSVPHQLVLSDAGELKFATIAALDKDWLNLSNSLNTVEPGHYYFVLEQAHSAMAASEQFRIKTADARKYFETGFRVTIDPAGKGITAESLKREFLDRAARLGQLKIEVDRKTDLPPCYSYVPVTVVAQAGNAVERGVLMACSTREDAATAPPTRG